MQLLSKLKSGYGNIRKHTSVKPTDVILASFPKSGNTWLRFIIANIYNELNPSLEEINFHTIHEVLPSLGDGVSPAFKNFPAIYKTHDPFHPAFKKVILLLRNPADGLFSFYNYLNGEKKQSISFGETIRHTENGITAIVEHTQSYIRSDASLLLLTYERLHRQPLEEMKKLCDFISLEAEDTILQRAIDKSSFSSMRKSEEEKGRKFGSKDFTFTRSGKVGEGKQEMSPEDHDYLLGEMKKSPILYFLYG